MTTIRDSNANAEKSVVSAISSLKEIVTIVTGVTVTNGMAMFLTGGDYVNVKSLRDLSFQGIVLFLLLMANIIRFYHRNMRHLDTIYVEADSSWRVKEVGGKRVAFDFFAIFGESLFFASLSFYLGRPTEFFAIFTSLLIVDVVWCLGGYQYTPDRERFEHQKRWALNNTIAVFSLLAVIAASSILQAAFLFYLLSSVIILNTTVDFVVSRGLYFPSLCGKKTPEAVELNKDQDR